MSFSVAFKAALMKFLLSPRAGQVVKQATQRRFLIKGVSREKTVVSMSLVAFEHRPGLAGKMGQNGRLLLTDAARHTHSMVGQECFIMPPHAFSTIQKQSFITETQSKRIFDSVLASTLHTNQYQRKIRVMPRWKRR